MHFDYVRIFAGTNNNIMKLYIKDNIISRCLILNTESATIINPSEEQIYAEGWIDYIAPTTERTIEEARVMKLAEIESFDLSSAVNSFEFNGNDMWIDKATRVGLMNAISCYEVLGKDIIGIDNISVTLPLVKAKAMLASLEAYALECYNVTLEHKNMVKTITDIEHVDKFDVTIGYPTKLVF